MLPSFTLFHIVVFLERLGEIGATALPKSHIKHLNDVYEFNSTPNVEIRLRWYNFVLKTDAASLYTEDAAAWLVEPLALKGRMKFCRPVFQAIHMVDPKLARSTWIPNAKFFHPIARRLIDKVAKPGFLSILHSILTNAPVRISASQPPINSLMRAALAQSPYP
jgi:leukotriene-A4 hydrolase